MLGIARIVIQWRCFCSERRRLMISVFVFIIVGTRDQLRSYRIFATKIANIRGHNPAVALDNL
jgi:hypothetical protein